MQTAPITTNPFALMIDPKAIFDRIEHSERLERLQRRVCRPLDRPLLDLEGGARAPAMQDDGPIEPAALATDDEEDSSPDACDRE